MDSGLDLDLGIEALFREGGIEGLEEESKREALKGWEEVWVDFTGEKKKEKVEKKEETAQLVFDFVAEEVEETPEPQTPNQPQGETVVHDKRRTDFLRLMRNMALASKYEKGVGETHEIKHFTLQHEIVVSLFMSGYSLKEIAQETGLTYGRVNQILHAPQARRTLAAWKAGVELELDAMLPLTVDAVREGLLDKDTKIKLAAVDRYTRLSGRENSSTNVTVNVVQEARNRFLEGLKELAKQEKVIDGEFHTVD